MTVTNITNQTEYAGDGADFGPFSTVWPFFDEEVLDTDYSVTGGDGSNGSITFLLAAPPATDTIVLLRLHDQEQEIDLTTGDKLPAETVEEGLDRATLKALDAYLATRARTIRVPDGDPASVNLQVPDHVARASSTLGFDANGDITIIAQTIGTASVSPFWAGVLATVDADTARNAANLNAGELTLTTSGDILYHDGSGYQRLPVGSNGEFLQLVAGVPSWEPIDDADIPSPTPPMGYRYGMITSPDSGGGDIANDVNVTAGIVRDVGNNLGINLAAEITKQLDTGSAWADGDNAAGRAAGVAHAQDTWYHVFVMSSADGTLVDVGFDTSISAANLLLDSAVTAYFGATVRYRRIGSVMTDSQVTPENRPWIQRGRHFMWDGYDGGLDYDVTGTGFAPPGVLVPIAVPIDVRVKPVVRMYIPSDAVQIHLQDPALSAEVSAYTTWPLAQASVSSDQLLTSADLFTNTNSEIRVVGEGAANDELRLTAVAWEDFIDD
jgi:hypothetical protein